MASGLLVREIYSSIQGESTWAGWPCIFVRLTGCDLRCSYCDSVYAFSGGECLTVEAVLREVDRLANSYSESDRSPRLPLVEITGGEPLLQTQVNPLMERLCDSEFTVLLETSGAHEIRHVDSRVHRIVDLKCPSSGESDRVLLENIDSLRPTDEVKFVIGTQQDYEWAREMEQRHQLTSICPVLFSSVAPLTPEQTSPVLNAVLPDHLSISRRELVENILRDKLLVRFQLQMHKFIWPPDQVGV
ncbi:MAG: 7-carboxy-7-deazaguanine synthase [Verrucomicrobia subdivision 3 bacterium]|nr:7-carboxy-7-deazaguanine synthase [Limisphaerales bacterium]MCS1412362.1 7-carboxy-7-deazaguanine synthase [Limisphaerales bacterium]